MPPRGIAVATISSLLESCRTSNQLKLPTKLALTQPVLVRSDKSTNTTLVIDSTPNGNGIAHLHITDEKCAVQSSAVPKTANDGGNQNRDSDDKSPFSNLPFECMCTCGGGGNGIELEDRSSICEHSTAPMKCSRCISNKSNEQFNQQQINQNDVGCNDNSRQLIGETKNCINCSRMMCERCSRNSNKLNDATVCCSVKCDCIHSIEVSSCSVHLTNKSKKNNVNVVSGKSADSDGIASRAEMHDKVGLSISESFENTEAEASHVLPTTPSPIISISSGMTGGGEDERLNRDNQTPSLVSPIDDEKLSTVRDSCSSNNISSTTDASGATTSTGNGAGKRGKTDAKLVLDLNDRSKYTKEVSV